MLRACTLLLCFFTPFVGAVPEEGPYLKAKVEASARMAEGQHRTFSARFSTAESPLSGHGAWLGGRTVGLDWADVATVPGLAFGLESGTDGFDDSTALVGGASGPNQEAEATVHALNPNDTISEEVELRLRSALSPHRCTGYEINFRCLKTKDAYTEIVRWDGPLGKFTYLSHKDGAQYGVGEGDVVKATMIGNVIKVYLNGVLVNEATDGTFATGNPGLGFFLRNATGLGRDYGFTRFSATDAP